MLGGRVQINKMNPGALLGLAMCHHRGTVGGLATSRWTHDNLTMLSPGEKSEREERRGGIRYLVKMCLIIY